VLPLYKNTRPIVYHKFAVYSLFDNKTSKVKPKYVNCNNCGVTHYVEEFCKSEIKLGKEDVKSIRSIEEVSLSLPEKLTKVLKEYNSTIDIYEEAEDIIENVVFPKSIIIKREIIDEDHHLKVLTINGEDKIKITSEVLNNTIIGEEI
jgi:hypothetical protein